MFETDQHNISLLIEKCRKGNARAQYRLYRQYSKAMYNLACRFLNNREDAEDILQETFTECFRNLDTFRSESTFGAWLKRILVNRCINHLRKKSIVLVYPENLPDDSPENDETDPPYDISEIFRCIEMLPDGYRIVLTLHLLEGYDHAEISEILRISESTSKTQYARARAKLKNMIKKKKNG